MSGREVKVGGRTVWVAEGGSGDTLVYLHGFVDIHSTAFGWLPFHEGLLSRFSVIAPAHPGCAGSDEDETMETADDVAFHYAELFDTLGLDKVHLVGSCVGGWIAAEIAVRYPERVRSLSLLGATGLYVPDQPIADLFWYAQPDDGVAFRGLRDLLFENADTAIGLDFFPDGRTTVDLEVLRYKMFRFANTIGFRPPYLYNRKLRQRLRRYQGPSLAVWGAADKLVPRSHADAYVEGLADSRLEIVDGAGHSVAVEQPEQAARLVSDFAST